MTHEHTEPIVSSTQLEGIFEDMVRRYGFADHAGFQADLRALTKAAQLYAYRVVANDLENLHRAVRRQARTPAQQQIAEASAAILGPAADMLREQARRWEAEQ